MSNRYQGSLRLPASTLMVSFPHPPRTTSSPLPPSRWSLPLLPLTESFPPPPASSSFPPLPSSRSAPLPPVTWSRPSPAQTMSSPPPPRIRSSPSSATMTSRRDVPIRTSSPSVPTIVAGWPTHCLGVADASPAATTAAMPTANVGMSHLNHGRLVVTVHPGLSPVSLRIVPPASQRDRSARRHDCKRLVDAAIPTDARRPLSTSWRRSPLRGWLRSPRPACRSRRGP